VLLVDCIWAPVTAILGVAANALLNLGFLMTYPSWAAVAVSCNVLAIYALVVPAVEPRRAGPSGDDGAAVVRPAG